MLEAGAVELAGRPAEVRVGHDLARDLGVGEVEPERRAR